MIDITGIDLVKFVQKVYELSSPQGLGVFHFTPTPLSVEQAMSMVDPNDRCPVSLDYVHGRACKMTVFNNMGKWEINDAWYDHTDEQLQELLKTFNIQAGVSKEHNISCNCYKCRS